MRAIYTVGSEAFTVPAGSQLAAFLLSTALCLAAGTAAAQPAVTSVSGTASQSQTLVVSGSAFGTKSGAAPVVFDTLDSGNFSGYWASHYGSVTSSNQRDPNSSRNFTYNYAGTSNSNQHLTGASSPTARTWFMSYMFELGTDWTWGSCTTAGTGNLSNIKVFRIWSPGDSGDESAIVTMDSGACIGTGMAWFARGSVKTNCSLNPTSLALGVWHRMDTEFVDSSSNNSTDGRLRVYMDGATVCSGDNVNFSANTGNRKRPYDMGFWNSWGDSHTDSNTYSEDDMYADSTLQRVELCPQASWSSRSICELQPPTAWSANSVSVTVNQGAFTSGQTAYLYVVDANGSVNGNGFPITIGGGSGGGGGGGGSSSTPPAAPTNVKILP